jgi:iron complex outermembrane receptor protein
LGDVTLRLIAEHYESNELFANSVLVAPFTQYADGTPYTKSLVTAGAKYGYDNVIFEPWSRLLNLNSPRPVRTTQSAFSGQATWKIGANTLESITAFRRYTFDARNDGDGSPLDIIDWTGTISSNRQWSEELRLSSPAGEKLEYVAGLYYYHLSLWSNSPTAFGSLASTYYGAVNPATLGGVLQNTIGTPVTNSYAAFAQANYHLADAWTATAGLRETKESKSATITNPISGGVDPATLSAADQAVYAGQIQTGTASTSFSANALSWLASLSHPLGEDTNTYVTAARGFKSGGINIEVTNVPLVVAPETALDFEAGIKTQLWDRRLQLNANLYWSTIHNYQGNFQSANPVLGQYIANVGDVRVRGLELESGLRATESLRLRFTGAYNDAVYRNFTNATCPAELADAASICDYSGKVLPFAPHWTGTLAADYVRNLAPDLVAYAGGSEVAHSTENVNSGLSRFGVQTGYAQTNLQAGLIGRNGGYDLSLWVKNLFDAQYYTALGPTKVLGVRVIAGTPGDPRTYGVTLRLHF